MGILFVLALHEACCFYTQFKASFNQANVNSVVFNFVYCIQHFRPTIPPPPTHFRVLLLLFSFIASARFFLNSCHHFFACMCGVRCVLALGRLIQHYYNTLLGSFKLLSILTLLLILSHVLSYLPSHVNTISVHFTLY